MSTHTSSILASWSGSFDGRGAVRANGFSQTVTLPTDFGGLGEGASPEDLLLSALASCYLITLGIMLDKSGARVESLKLAADLLTDKHPQPAIREAVLRVRVVGDIHPERLQELAERAEKFCLIARAVQGNISKRVEVKVEAPRSRVQTVV